MIYLVPPIGFVSTGLVLQARIDKLEGKNYDLDRNVNRGQSRFYLACDAGTRAVTVSRY
jgi:hypothetical protein